VRSAAHRSERRVQFGAYDGPFASCGTDRSSRRFAPQIICVSLYLRTSPWGTDVKLNRTAFKDLAKECRS
jgi:hypothetical protein